MDDAVGEVLHERSRTCGNHLERNFRNTFKQALARFENDGGDVQPKFIDQSGFEVLVEGRSTARNRYGLTSGRT